MNDGVKVDRLTVKGWNIVVDDGYVAYQYQIDVHPSYSINELVKAIQEIANKDFTKP